MTRDLLAGGVKGKKNPFQHIFEAHGFWGCWLGIPYGGFPDISVGKPRPSLTFPVLETFSYPPSLLWPDDGSLACVHSD